MNIDRRALADFATRLQLTAERAAMAKRQLSRLLASGGNLSTDAALTGTLASIASLDEEIAVMRRMLNAFWLRAVGSGASLR
jgi:hypothetical protein